MWQPDPGWEPLPGGRSGSTVYAGFRQGRRAIIKRLHRPVPGDPHELSVPAQAAWWRREADVALDGSLTTTSGVRAATVLAVDEDDEGITLSTLELAAGAVPITGLRAARAWGEFAGNSLTPEPWWSRQLLADRLARLEDRGGWPTLARTTLADVADRLWRRRGHWLRIVGDLPQVPSHGDPTPGNLLGVTGSAGPTGEPGMIGIDWATFGSAPIGTDVGYLALSSKEDLRVLLEAYVAGHGSASFAEAETGARVMAVYTALTRTEWALARVASGPGALAGKYRHPSVAPSIRALQRLFPDLETLL